MTTALCLMCGSTKFGAWCPCPVCSASSSGDQNLDIMFSDHYVAVETLKELGGVLRTIITHPDVPPDMRPKIFLAYVSKNCPKILTVQFKPEDVDGIEQKLAVLDLPGVTWRPGHRNDPARPKGCTSAPLLWLIGACHRFLT